jgi:recombination protein RecR
VTPTFEHLQNLLKKLPGLGYRSAERLALHLLVESPESLPPLLDALEKGKNDVGRCQRCGNLAESELCTICADESREPGTVCVVERVPDLLAIERSGAYRGLYHVLHGKLSPIHNIGPDDLNIRSLEVRLDEEPISEVILALSNDIEAEATCHYLHSTLFEGRELSLSRIGFGLPSGSGVTFADPTTVRSALSSRQRF